MKINNRFFGLGALLLFLRIAAASVPATASPEPLMADANPVYGKIAVEQSMNIETQNNEWFGELSVYLLIILIYAFYGVRQKTVETVEPKQSL